MASGHSTLECTTDCWLESTSTLPRPEAVPNLAALTDVNLGDNSRVNGKVVEPSWYGRGNTRYELDYKKFISVNIR